MRRAAASRFPVWALPITVGIIAAGTFIPALQNGFISWDDDQNFVTNTHFRGLGITQLRWMWTTFHLGHYVPLSWMSLGLDYELWGMDPSGYHLTNVILHAANAVLVFLVARRLVTLALPDHATRDPRALDLAAAIGALLFATHPLRVESVAWVTERRDVLSGALCSASLLCYLRSLDGRAHRRWTYVASLFFFLCALLSKATSVTLPAVFALLNVYPLRRLGTGRWTSDEARRVYRELAPFVVAAAAVIPLTLVALAPPQQLGFGAKLAVSAFSLGFYAWKTLVPIGLSPLYAMPAQIHPLEGRFVASYILLAALVIGAIAWRKRVPAIAVALAVFVVVELPMLGIVQNGPQIAADRYTYHASPALAVLLAGGALLSIARYGTKVVGAAIVIIATFVTLSWKQTMIWHDSATFWSYVVRTDSTSAIGHTALGTLDLHADRLDDAVRHYRRALATDSTYFEAHDNLGIALSRQGHFAEAAEHYRRALVINPRSRETHNNLGVAAAHLGQFDEAIAEYSEAIELDPEYADAHTNWGNALVRVGRSREAIAHYREALRLQPSNADAHHNWGVALAQEGRLGDAIEQFKQALAINPNYTEARDYLEQATRLARRP